MGRRGMGRAPEQRAGGRRPISTGAAGATGGGGPGALDVARESAEKFRPGRLVEAAAGLALVSTFALMALDSRLVSLDDLGVGGGVLGASSDVFLATFSLRGGGGGGRARAGSSRGPAQRAVRAHVGGTRVFAGGVVGGDGSGVGVRGGDGEPGWRTLTWGMLPLHASGVCACAQHFFFNAADLEWLVTAQGALTMAGNAGMCYAAGRIADVDRNTEEASDRGGRPRRRTLAKTPPGRGTSSTSKGSRRCGARTTTEPSRRRSRRCP